MSGKQYYLILSPDGSRATMFLTDRAGLEEHLAEATRDVAQGGFEPGFLDAIPTTPYGSVDPGQWQEHQELILEVRVVVPQPVTVKWQIP